MTVGEWTSLIAGVVSILLALIAIILSIVFYFKSNESEKNSEIALNDIKKETSILSALSNKLINRLTNYITSPKPQDEVFLELIKKFNPIEGVNSLADNEKNPDSGQLEQLRVDNLIAALYYASTTNVVSQLKLPENMKDIECVDESRYISQLVDQSKNDFFIIKSWISYVPEKIESSPNKHLWDQALEFEAGIRSTIDYYVERSS